MSEVRTGIENMYSQYMFFHIIVNSFVGTVSDLFVVIHVFSDERRTEVDISDWQDSVVCFSVSFHQNI